MLEVLSHRRYRHLFLAQVTALAGTGLTTVALALLAHDLAAGQAGVVLGTALAIKMVAYVCIAPLAGAYASRLPRRTLLVGLDLLRASVVCALPFVAEVWQIYVLIFLLNAASAGFTPVFQATIPDLLEDERQYTRALSLSRLAYDLENLLSPMAAAVLLMVMSFDVLFLLNGLAFLISAGLVVSVVLPSPQAAEDESPSVWRKVSHGMRIYLKTPRLRGLLALNMAVSAAGAMQIVNTVVYVRSTLGLGEQAVAMAFAAVGGGSMLVALLLPKVLERVRERPVMLAGGTLMTVSLFLGLLAPGFIGLMGLWFLLGAGASLVMTPTGRLLKQSCHSEDRPALFAAQFSLSHGCWLVAYPLAGWFGSQAGLIETFALLGTIALVSTALATRVWPSRDPVALEHDHAPVEHSHLHYHDDHHQHEHEGWEGPEPHRHPHHHPRGRHRHIFVIDGHHTKWPS
ncbi:MFS transporter [Chromohalobacter israelensis]|uniref:Predicted arabinose efflux permease, MFS family n=1 Tax=Billgrantia gudaonensis TaxID=376427 RepID=A0A1G8V2B1_9GAMM|nr:MULTISPECIES: MFS transporter [Halomonas]ERS82424.1 major facilitator transporter [Halomonas sp. PBN3]SDJ60171.1 Predicted arabinose efflux permease, MFS family [Halomonas gudaonensis]